MKRYVLAAMLGCALLESPPARAQSGGPYTLKSTTIDNGGVTFGTGNMSSLGGTTGQPDAGLLTGSAYTLRGGFWSEFSAPPNAPRCATPRFAPATNFDVADSQHIPNAVAVRDFNGDGHLDLAVLNANSHVVSILLGTGTGSFGAARDFPSGGSGNVIASSVGVGDFNGDGHDDLVTSNWDTVSILLGTGTATFGTPTEFSLGGGGVQYVVVDDFNGDDHRDLAVAMTAGSKVLILLGTGTGGFGAPTFAPFPISYPESHSPVSIAVGDFNGDGHRDLAVANAGGAQGVWILLGTGTGNFGTATKFPVGPSSGLTSVAARDFNGDGHLDLAVTGFGLGVSILLGTGTGSFGAPNLFRVTGSPTFVVAEDFNGDGPVDLAVATQGGVLILQGTGTGSFMGPSLLLGGVSGSFGNSLAVGDFDGDGDLDLAWATRTQLGYHPSAAIFLNTCAQQVPVITGGATAGSTRVFGQALPMHRAGSWRSGAPDRTASRTTVRTTTPCSVPAAPTRTGTSTTARASACRDPCYPVKCCSPSTGTTISADRR